MSLLTSFLLPLAVSPSPVPISAPVVALTKGQEHCGVTDPSAISESQAKCITAFESSLAGDSIWIVIIKAVLVLVFLLVSVLFAVWFERRVIGRLQQRPGPNVHGPFGLLQSIQDAHQAGLQGRHHRARCRQACLHRGADHLGVLRAPDLCGDSVWARNPHPVH